VEDATRLQKKDLIWGGPQKEKKGSLESRWTSRGGEGVARPKTAKRRGRPSRGRGQGRGGEKKCLKPAQAPKEQRDKKDCEESFRPALKETSYSLGLEATAAVGREGGGGSKCRLMGGPPQNQFSGPPILEARTTLEGENCGKQTSTTTTT